MLPHFDVSAVYKSHRNTRNPEYGAKYERVYDRTVCISVDQAAQFSEEIGTKYDRTNRLCCA